MSTGARSDKNAPYFQALVPATTHVRSFTATSAQTAAVSAATTLVSVFATQDCWILTGADPTAVVVTDGATGTSMFLPGGIKDFIGIEPGHKIAVVRSGTSGILYVTECA